jgi:hypothetical protein
VIPTAASKLTLIVSAEALRDDTHSRTSTAVSNGSFVLMSTFSFQMAQS